MPKYVIFKTTGQDAAFHRYLSVGDGSWEMEVTLGPLGNIVELDIKRPESFAIFEYSDEGVTLKLYEGMVAPDSSIEGNETGPVEEEVYTISDGTTELVMRESSIQEVWRFWHDLLMGNDDDERYGPDYY